MEFSRSRSSVLPRVALSPAWRVPSASNSPSPGSPRPNQDPRWRDHVCHLARWHPRKRPLPKGTTVTRRAWLASGAFFPSIDRIQPGSDRRSRISHRLPRNFKGKLSRRPVSLEMLPNETGAVSGFWSFLIVQLIWIVKREILPSHCDFSSASKGPCLFNNLCFTGAGFFYSHTLHLH